jgi:hypothetical protein
LYKLKSTAEFSRAAEQQRKLVPNTKKFGPKHNVGCTAQQDRVTKAWAHKAGTGMQQEVGSGGAY